MRTLDRYVVRSFLFSAVLWFVVLMALRIITDMFVNMDEFAELGESHGWTFLQILQHAVRFYGARTLVYVAELGGVVIVAAAAFTLARMNSTNEVVAMLASGVSLHRVVLPIVLCSMALSGLIVFDQEVLIPPLAPRLVLDHDDPTGESEFAVEFMTDGRRTVWYAGRFSPAEGQMQNVIVTPRDADYRQLAGIHARQLTYRNVVLDGKKLRGWLGAPGVLARGRWLINPDTGSVYTYLSPELLLDKLLARARARGVAPPPIDWEVPVVNPFGEDEHYGLILRADQLEIEKPRPGVERGGTLINPVFTYVSDLEAPEDQRRTLALFLAERARWTTDEQGEWHWQLTGGRLFVPSDLSAQDIFLRESSRWMDYLSMSQITQLLQLKRIPDEQSARLVRHIRVTQPLHNLVMLLLALPFILSRQRNIKASAALAVLTVGGYYAMIFICRNVDLPPVWAAWLPILVFGPISAVMLDSVKT